MAKDFSFDALSDYDLGEMTNAVDQTQRELATRYDFKGTAAKIGWMDDKVGVVVEGDTKYHLDSIVDVFQGKLIKRNVSLKALDLSTEPVQGGQSMKWTIKFRKGLDQDKAKLITKAARDAFPKVKTSIQGDAVRISSTSKDELQGVMTALRAMDFDFPLQFTNYR
jgi:hypothetical protein